MKIGIVTFHAALNVGAVLQAYALQTYLKMQGHEVEFIDYVSKRKLSWKNFIGKGIGITFYKWQDLFCSIYFKRIEKFNTTLNLSKIKYKSIDDLRSNPPNLDVYIAGSDQIWNVGSKKTIDDIFLLDFGAKNTKRISFAASLGQGEVPVEFEQHFKFLLSKFNFISLREKDGYNYIKRLLPNKKEIFHICDPTFLLNSNEYRKIIKKPNIKYKEYLVSYALWHFESDQLKSLNYIKSKLKLKHINLRNPDTGIRFSKAKNIIVKPHQWLHWVLNSDFVVCCSFHIVVFSLIFHKPFVVLTHKENVRIHSLLKPLNLLDRIIINYNENRIDEILSDFIKWNDVDEYLQSERNRGVQYLKESIG